VILAASTQQTVGMVILIVLILGIAAYLILENRVSTSSNVESFLKAPNRKSPPDDDVFEGPRLDRFLSWALVSMSVVALGLPVYWLGEPGRQTGAIRGFDKRSVHRGEESFGAAHNGFNCAQCHGSNGQGGVAVWNVNDYDASGNLVMDAATGKAALRPVSWIAPRINDIGLRYKKQQIANVLIYGRGTNKPMPAWGLKGGGPANDQQIFDLVNYLRYESLAENETARKVYNDTWESNGHKADDAYEKAFQAAAAEAQEESTKALEEAKKLDSNKGKSDGEILFNSHCARCHTNGYSWGEPKTSGGGWYGPSLNKQSLTNQFPDPKDQAAFIKNGVDDQKAYGTGGVNHWSGGGMPYFANILTDEQIDKIVAYERSL
jgi:mono/diheme cytochrome c family protein